MGVNSTPQLYKDMTDRINEQNPDIVLFAGDVVTSSYGAMRDPDAYSSVLNQIHATTGKYVIYGNHDVDEPLLGGFTYVGAENAHRNPQMDQFIRDCGFTLLRDETVKLPELNGLVIAGRRDESRPGDGVKVRATLEELMCTTAPEEPVLLLQHEPSDLTELDKYGIDMSVSGHTHDGQIFPGNIFTRIKGPQSYGLKKWGDATVVVTSGVGYYGPPIRVATISEIVVIDLK
jgi:predicted MPP superfamily phosphohydrolase